MARGAQTVGRGAARPVVAPGSSFLLLRGTAPGFLPDKLRVGSLCVLIVPWYVLLACFNGSYTDFVDFQVSGTSSTSHLDSDRKPIENRREAIRDH